MIHSDRFERAVFRAQSAIHADVDIDKEVGRVWNGTSSFWIVQTHNPNALRWADLGAYPAGNTAVLTGPVFKLIVDQERNVAEFLGQSELFFWILNGKDPLRLRALTDGKSFGIVVAMPQPPKVIHIGGDKMLERYAQPFDDPNPIH